MQRSRQVPEYVIDRMISQFELPFISEGFDEINIIYDSKEESSRYFKSERSKLLFVLLSQLIEDAEYSNYRLEDYNYSVDINTRYSNSNRSL